MNRLRARMRAKTKQFVVDGARWIGSSLVVLGAWAFWDARNCEEFGCLVRVYAVLPIVAGTALLLFTLPRQYGLIAHVAIAAALTALIAVWVGWALLAIPTDIGAYARWRKLKGHHV